MAIENLILFLIKFGYIMVFGVLGITTLMLQIPKEKGIENYKKARTTIGLSLFAIVLYCIICFSFSVQRGGFIYFWLLVTFTLIHSWLTYSTMLFLLETPRFLRKHFLVDGLAPISILIVTGVIGLIFPSIRDWIQIVFGCIFGLKCLYMFLVCHTEYNKCEKELSEYYDEIPDIKWIKRLIYLSLFMSVMTIVEFYVEQIETVYFLSIPIIYAYIVLKIINFAPKKIDAIRKQNATEDQQPAIEKKKDLRIEDKIAPKIEAWVASKKFCTSDLTIKDVAMDMGTNHNYLSQYLNNHLGVTFQVWLNTLRIEESKVLLTDGNKKSIEEIGLMVGFSQIYNFSRWFRIVTGTTPFRYRKDN